MRENQGQWVRYGGFLAMRDTTDNSWRLSRVSVNRDTSLTLTLVGQYLHLSDVEDYILEYRANQFS